MGRWEDGRMGRWEDGKRGGWEDGRTGGGDEGSEKYKRWFSGIREGHICNGDQSNNYNVTVESIS